VEDTEYGIQIWDTAGQEDLMTLRTLSYPNTDIFLLCFSIDNRTSFNNITAIWTDEVGAYVKSPVFLLIGTKADMRDSSSECIYTSEGRELARKIGAYDYIECSAIRNEGVKEVFDSAIIKVIKDNEITCRCCSVQ
jgi:small GTP-binding protein